MVKVMILLGIVFMLLRPTENAIKPVYFGLKLRATCSTMGGQVDALVSFIVLTPIQIIFQI
jgi:hypothetical protein